MSYIDVLADISLRFLLRHFNPAVVFNVELDQMVALCDVHVAESSS